MRTLLSQDYVTIRGNTATMTVTQSEHMWLDLPGVSHCVAWLEVKEITAGGGTVSMSYQTAPMVNESLFSAMSGPTSIITMPFAPTVGVTPTVLLKDHLTVPLSRWFRWQLTASGTSSTWDITFRLFLAVQCLRSGQGRHEQKPAR